VPEAVYASEYFAVSLVKTTAIPVAVQFSTTSSAGSILRSSPRS